MIVDDQAPPSYQEAVQGTRGLHDSQPQGSSSRTGAQPLPVFQTTSQHAVTPCWSPIPSDRALIRLAELDFSTRIQQRLARSPGKPFDPRPPSFARAPTSRIGQTYSPFEPISLSAKGRFAGNGFKPMYPGMVLVDHDVSPADWARFLEDLEVAGRQTGAQRIVSEITPITMHMGVTGLLVTKAIKKGMARKKEPQVQETLEVWCQNFFRARRLDVFIHDGLERLTASGPGESIPPLDPLFQSHAALSRTSSSSSSSSSCSASSHEFHGPLSRAERKERRREMKSERKALKKQHREEKKAMRRDRRATRRAAKGKQKEKGKAQFSLVLAPL